MEHTDKKYYNQERRGLANISTVAYSFDYTTHVELSLDMSK